MRITGNSKIELHKLRSSSHPDEHNLYEIVRLDTGESLKVDKNVVELVKHLDKGKTVEEAAQEINFSVHVVQMLLKILREADFFKSIDGVPIQVSQKKTKVKISAHSKIDFFELRISPTPDEHNLYAIVRWDTDDTLKVDNNVVGLVKHLSKGKTVQEAAREIHFSLDVVLLLLKMLQDAHFFKSVDGTLLYDTGKKINPWLSGIDSKWFQWIIYKPLIYIVLFVSFTGILTGFLLKGIPTYKSFFWTSDLFVVAVSFFIVDIVLLFLHEFAHFCVTKAAGGQAVMRLNYRYIYIVAETESYHLGLVPKSKRYMVYLAGMAIDLFIVGLIYWFLIASTFFDINIGILYNFLIAIILLQLSVIIWQFNVFLETDLYNFLSEYLGIENLRNDAKKYIAQHTKKWKKMTLFPVKWLLLFFSSDSSGSSDDLRQLNKSQKKKLLIYVLILIAGMVFTSLEFIFYSIPADFTFLIEATNDLMQGIKQADMIAFLKACAVIIIVLCDYILLLLFKSSEFARNIKRKRVWYRL